MTVRTSSLFVVLLGAVTCAGCSGGGGSPAPSGGGGGTTPTATPVPTAIATPTLRPTATPVPAPTYVLPSASAAVLSTYSIDSSPHGLAVTIDGQSLGKTPATAAPTYAKTLHTVTIVPAAAGTATPVPYSVSFAQTANGSHAVFYNESVDTTGQIASISSTGALRFPTQLNRAVGLRRPASAFVHRARFDSARIVVHYDATRFGSNDTLGSHERSHGGLLATTFAQSAHDITRIVTLRPDVRTADALRDFAADPTVTGVDRVRLRYPLSAKSSGPVYPNDPFFVSGAEWYLNVIDTPDAWGYGRGSKTVNVAIVDTGYDPHQTEVAPGVTYSERIVGGSIDSASGAATDTDGHGTFISAIASAQTNNDAGFAGVSYGASLQEYKVFTDGTSPAADSADVAEAIREAVAHGANVIVAALGGEADAGPDPLERDAVAYAISKGVTVVAGSGDEGNATLDYPAAYDGVVSVGASAVNDAASPGGVVGGGNFEYVPTYSNGGGVASIVAPGGDPSSSRDTDGIHWIDSAYTTQPYPGDAACPSGTTAASCGILSSGTSASAAEVAGTVALLLSQKSSLGPAQVTRLLQETADNIDDPRQGSGRLDAHAALVALTGDPSPVPALAQPAYGQFVAFAYTNSGGTTPKMIDVTYPRGVPVGSTGSFRIADIPVAALGTYKIAVWVDTNGNGVVDAGDYFGAVSNACGTSGACAGANAVKVAPVAAGFVLP